MAVMDSYFCHEQIYLISNLLVIKSFSRTFTIAKICRTGKGALVNEANLSHNKSWTSFECQDSRVVIFSRKNDKSGDISHVFNKTWREGFRIKANTRQS